MDNTKKASDGYNKILRQSVAFTEKEIEEIKKKSGSSSVGGGIRILLGFQGREQ